MQYMAEKYPDMPYQIVFSYAGEAENLRLEMSRKDVENGTSRQLFSTVSGNVTAYVFTD